MNIEELNKIILDFPKLQGVSRGKGGTYPILDLGDFPSVTTVQNLISKPFLLPWKIKITLESLQAEVDKLYKDKVIITPSILEEVIKKVKGIDKTVSKEAMATGTAVHEVIENYLSGKEYTSGINRYTQNSFNAFKKWEEDYNFKPILTEQTVYSKTHKFAGTLDCYGMVRGKPFVIDWKTSKEIYPDYLTQVNAYRVAFIEMLVDFLLEKSCPSGVASLTEGIISIGVGVLRLDKLSGEYQWKEYPTSSDKNNNFNLDKDFKKFNNLVQYWWGGKVV